MTETPAALSTMLPGSPTSPGRARRFVTEALSSWSLEQLADSVQLLACELVTNAALHVRSELDLRVVRHRSAVRVEVIDTSPAPPRAAPQIDGDEEATTGRGLLLVQALASNWSVDPAADGKVVWFEVAA